MLHQVGGENAAVAGAVIATLLRQPENGDDIRILALRLELGESQPRATFTDLARAEFLARACLRGGAGQFGIAEGDAHQHFLGRAAGKSRADGGTIPLRQRQRAIERGGGRALAGEHHRGVATGDIGGLELAAAHEGLVDLGIVGALDARGQGKTRAGIAVAALAGRELARERGVTGVDPRRGQRGAVEIARIEVLCRSRTGDERQQEREEREERRAHHSSPVMMALTIPVPASRSGRSGNARQ